jgi:adenosylhomocysteine nucleosidase
MKIGIIGPCEDEIMPFIEKMNCVAIESCAKLQFHIGKYSRLDIVALFSGVCKVNAAIAAQILIDKYDITHMIVSGVAGAIDKKLKIFDTVISSEVAYHDVAEEILTQYHPWMKSVYFEADKKMIEGIIGANANDASVFIGKIVTGEAFIDQDGRGKIIETYNPQCVDMETASIAHVCYVNTIPFVAIRSVSDTPFESGSAVFEKYSKRAAKKSIGVLIKYLDSL